MALDASQHRATVNRCGMRCDLLVGVRLAHLVGKIGNSLGGVVVVRWGQATKEKCNSEEDHDKNADLAQNRLARTKLGPVARSLTSVALDLVVAELVVDHATESDRVAKELQGSDRSAPDHHGGGNEHDILEDTAEGQDDGRSLANLD